MGAASLGLESKGVGTEVLCTLLVRAGDTSAGGAIAQLHYSGLKGGRRAFSKTVRRPNLMTSNLQFISSDIRFSIWWVFLSRFFKVTLGGT